MALHPRSEPNATEKGPYMSRSKTYGLALALIASAALSTACTRSDTTGPSDQTQASFKEGQGPDD